jgi:YesN/AraC family two-component response regulator
MEEVKKVNSILYVEDQNDIQEELVYVLEDYCDNLYTASNGEDGLELYKQYHPDIVISDIKMPKMSGIDMAQKIKEINPSSHIIFTTAFSDVNYFQIAIELQVDGYILKPIDLDLLEKKLMSVIEHIYLKKELKDINENLKLKVAKEVKKRVFLEKENFQNRKKAAMGDLIGIIAHQLKQPLNALNLSKDVMIMDFEDGLVDMNYLDDFDKKMTTQIAFMANSIDEFRNFFRPDKSVSPIKVEDSIEKSIDIIGNSITSKGIEISKEFNNSLLIKGIDTELQQVIMNIINNAKDALLENQSKNPYIKITTEEIIEDEIKHVAIHTEDNAGGIPDDVITKVFDQYFSTKGEKGTGLGLNLARMIIKDSLSGTISVKNTEVGALFTIIIKSCEEE